VVDLVLLEDGPVTECFVGEVLFLEGWHVGQAAVRSL